MILVKGMLRPDGDLPQVLARLERELDATRAEKTLPPERVIAAVERLGQRLRAGEFDGLLAQYLPVGMSREDLFPLLSRQALEEKVRSELGEEPWARRELERTTARLAPLGVLFHVAPGNMPGLPVYSVLEGLLTGNINLLKLPRGDKGLSLAALSLLIEEEPALADYIYAFDFPSSQRETVKALADLADGVVTWGGEEAVSALRELAPAGCKLIEWGHRLSFAYVSGYENREGELSALARHIVETGQRLCSFCQVIFLDTEKWEEGEAFCRAFLPHLERAAIGCRGVGGGAQATLSGHSGRLERIVDGRAAGEIHLPGRGCSVTLRPDRELELSPMEGNIFVKLLPRTELLPTLRRQRGRLQTAGLICRPERREELTDLLIRAGVTRITRAGTLSDAFPGEGHDGEYPLRRYTRVVDVER